MSAIQLPTGQSTYHPPSAVAVESSVDDIRARWVQRGIKRAFDLVVASLFLVLLLPVWVIIAIGIKATSPGPVVFRHTRVGRGGRRFEVLKFRTMHVGAEERLRGDPALYQSYVRNNFKLVPDPRLTRLGRHLRKASLDEIPQFLNVLRGQMSMVGPRPVVPEELAAYADYAPAYLGVTPGMTGIWQVTGRAHLGYPERARLDFEYVRGWNVLRDLKILLRTIPVVLTHGGAK